MNAAITRAQTQAPAHPLADEGTEHDVPADGAPAGWPLPDGLTEGDDLSEDPGLAAHGAALSQAEPRVPLTATDQQLADWITAVVDRDERALAALYDATFSRVHGLVRRIVRTPALAEEVVEDAYFQVWRQAVRFDPARGKALTWLLAIAHSRAIDALRREARFEHEELDDLQPESAGQQPPVDELLDLAQHQADLHRALMLLGAQPRQLVSLAFLRGLSHEEIAQQTRLPLGTVKSQIRRALHSLRDILGEGPAVALAS